MDGEPHQQTPDIDNLEKGILDALFADDKKVQNDPTQEKIKFILEH